MNLSYILYYGDKKNKSNRTDGWHLFCQIEKVNKNNNLRKNQIR